MIKPKSKRLNRSSYLLSIVLAFITFCVIGGILSALVDGIFGIKRVDGDVNGFVLPPLLIALFIYIYIAGIYRMHDLNTNGWFMLFIFLPFVNLVTGIYLFFVKSYPEQNKWGEVPHGVRIMWLDCLIKPKVRHEK